MNAALQRCHLDHTGGRNHNSGELLRCGFGAKLILGNQSMAGRHS